MPLIKNNLSTIVKDKILPLIAVGFPGGYKLFIILMITTFASKSVAIDFSKMFFWVTLLVTFTGIPIAALMISPKLVIKSYHKIILVVASSFTCFIIAYIIELNKYSYDDNLFIFLSVLCLSFYEVLKRYLLNEADFESLFYSSCFSVFLVSLLLLGAAFLGWNSPSLMLVFCFLSLILPLLYLQKSKKIIQTSVSSNFSEILKGFMKYALSNATSTSLLFILPILLIAEIGDSIATNLAQVFYITSLTYLIPHALSAKHIPNMRNNGINIKDIKIFFITILLFVFVTTIISTLLLQYFYLQWEIYFLLFFAMQISQLSLPFSNALMVKGEASIILKINLIASSFFIISTMLSIYFFKAGEMRAQLLLFGFIGFQFLKLLLNYLTSKKYIRTIN